jgi:methylenetetrahydrofolate dehydrogenase (NADP+)/methenyltetrahydrofolate cyclohydrolase
MTRILSGLELQGFIQERQAKQVRNLRQEHHIVPKLLVIMGEQASGASKAYVAMKQRYAAELLIDVEVKTVAQEAMASEIIAANNDDTVTGIIVQLPIDDPSETTKICNTIAPEKDVDGLGEYATFASATAEAIDWLLVGYNIDLTHKKIAIVGNGKLVGAPLARLWNDQAYDVTVLDEFSDNTSEVLLQSEVIVTAAGKPRLITSSMVPQNAVVVDAGTASENGELVGDVDMAVRERGDVTITPIKGGVGPLTITLLFDHVIQAALKKAGLL